MSVNVAFELPDELKDITYEKILADMLSLVPNQYDKLEGGFVHDMIAPSALEAAELIQFWLALGLKMNFHMWAQEQWLDHHAHDCGLVRKAATHAYTELKIVTTKDLTFQKGFIFSVPSEDDKPSIDFETIQDETCAAGENFITVRAVEAGKKSNVAADTIIIMKNPIKNIESITNPEAVTGGTEAESDESLRQRIDDFYAGHGASFVGNRADYIRWAKEIAGVGFVNCIPTYDGENTVKLVICDENGDGANEEKLKAVERHIFGTGHDDLERLAPIGIVKYEVAAPTPHNIYLSFDAKISAALSLVKSNICVALSDYFKTLADENHLFGSLRYQKVAAILADVPNLDDFKNLKINGGVENILFEQDEIPLIKPSFLTVGDWVD